ncbi:hypothetical protein PybrP1_004204 [[Pythium] brassicae (nom. inval.)]|nr:hypothetical protein PybrP1_004204 [[Pythium] brassicae (nom. inval.)]
MGCCSSKNRTERSALDALDSSISSAAAVVEKLQCAADAEPSAGVLLDDAASGASPCSINQQESALALLMGTVEGSLLLKSDGDPTPSARSLEQIEFSGVAGRGSSKTNADDAVIRAAELTSDFPPPRSPARSPARSPVQTSPRKAPVNYEDVPINSMYHRIHTVEAEAQAERRQQELREEAERREREMIEFKAVMLQP